MTAPAACNLVAPEERRIVPETCRSAFLPQKFHKLSIYPAAALQIGAYGHLFSIAVVNEHDWELLSAERTFRELSHNCGVKY